MKVSHMITLAFSTPCVFKLVTLFSFSLTGSHNQMILLHINSGPTKFYKMNEKYNMISIINFTMSIKIIAFLDLLQIYNQASNHMVFIRPLYATVLLWIRGLAPAREICFTFIDVLF